MNGYDFARDLYHRGRELVASTRDQAVMDDRLRWAREDLEDALLDVKRAVIALDSSALEEVVEEAMNLMLVVYRLWRDGPEPTAEE